MAAITTHHVDVFLTNKQMALGCLIGHRRHKSQAEGGGSVNDNVDTRSSERQRMIDSFGGRGEVAVSEYTGLPWNSDTVGPDGLHELSQSSQPVVGVDLLVRTRSGRRQLAVKLKDDPELRYVLVWGHVGNLFTVVGWDWGWNIKVPEYRSKPGDKEYLKNRYVPPTESLRPPYELLR